LALQTPFSFLIWKQLHKSMVSTVAWREMAYLSMVSTPFEEYARQIGFIFPQSLGWILKKNGLPPPGIVVHVGAENFQASPAWEATNFSDRRMRPSFFWSTFAPRSHGSGWVFVHMCSPCIDLPFFGGEQLSSRCSDSLKHKPHMAG